MPLLIPDSRPVLAWGSGNLNLDILLARIHEAIEMPIEFEGHQLMVGISIGVAIYPDRLAELDEILKIADQDMYRNKEQRKLKASQSA